MENVSTLWRSSREQPKEKSYIIMVHDYYNFGRDEVDIAYVREDEKVAIRNMIHGRSWSDWAWKVKKWCYVDDLLKIR